MLYEAGYDKIELYPATKGMNKNIAPELLKSDYSSYIENIMPTSLGEGRVRYGNSLIVGDVVLQDAIVEAFPFESAEGSKQLVLYFNGFETFINYTNLVIVNSNTIYLSTPDLDTFEADTYIGLRYNQPNGLTPILYFKIIRVQKPGNNNVLIEVDENSFPSNLQDFYVRQQTTQISYIANNSISITVPADFPEFYYYSDDQKIKLTINGVVTDLTIDNIDNTTPTQLILTFNENTVPAFTNADTVTLDYESKFPQLTNIYNSVGYIKVFDFDTGILLPGADQTISDLSLACIPRSEFFGNLLWLCNGVDPVMTWDGEKLKIYEEPVKEFANSFNRIDATHFSFISNAAFDITKYQNNNTIQLKINGVTSSTVCTNIAINADVITITSQTNLPNFAGQDRIELFYMDKPPRFNYMKTAHDRLWCLGSGAASIGYRSPEESLRVYYSYTPFSDTTPFRFFNENTKTVPSENISAKHGVADNLEAIANISGNLAFIGRKKTQIWSGIDPLTEDIGSSFSWASTIPIGSYHGNLVIELANDVYFLSENGIVSFGTFNIARQFAASTTANMDKLAMEYIDSINSNFDYRACRSFKYTNGSFCGFKIGLNNLIVSKYDTSLYWWGIFSGDFRKSSSFVSGLDNSLYLFINNQIYRYGDGMIGQHIYGDNNGNNLIDFIETKYVNNITNRYANKRYEIKSDYSSSVVINKGNTVNVIVRGDLVDSFTLQDTYKFKQKGDLLGTINLVNGEGLDPNNPDNTKLGMRLDSPTHTKKDRLKFLSSNFSVSIVGQVKNGPFVLKKIVLFGIKER